MARIFLTGATGYVGGDILHQLATSATPRHSITCLVRDASKAQLVSQAHSSVRIVQGDLDDDQLIESEARSADIVVHLAATGHLGSSSAIAKGLTSPERKIPGYWIQISGATLFATKEISEGSFGHKSDKVYDDIKDIDEILAVIADNPKRAVDNLVISQDASKVKTALIVGPHIYGTGRGPANTRSIQAPEIARATMELKEGFRLNEGKNSWSYIHVEDLSKLISSLVDAAVEQKKGLWNKEGIYLPENGNMTFGELSARIADEAHKQGLIPGGSVTKVVDAAAADKLSAHASILWGTNAILHSSRANQHLDWKPSRPSLADCITEIVRLEAKRAASAN